MWALVKAKMCESVTAMEWVLVWMKEYEWE
jgi:hypothetical protein